MALESQRPTTSTKATCVSGTIKLLSSLDQDLDAALRVLTPGLQTELCRLGLRNWDADVSCHLTGGSAYLDERYGWNGSTERP